MRILAHHAALGLSAVPTEPVTARSLDALSAYRARYVAFFGAEALAGLVVGVYQHSAVGRDVLCEILEALGAKPVALGRSDRFIPVDTEALRPEDVALAGRLGARKPARCNRFHRW